METTSFETEPESPTNITVSSDIYNIIKTLVTNVSVIFMSQQRGESEPNDLEKTNIAISIFNRNKANFLIKWGRYLDSDQLKFFDQFTEEKNDTEHFEETKLVLEDLRRNLAMNEKQIEIKNRRYEALQQMIKEDTYFSEIEMMKRDPLLYEQLVGQFMTEEEKRERDKYEISENVTFVKILMEGIERDNAEVLRAKEQQNEDCLMEESDSSDEERPVDKITNSVKSARPSTTRWGEFEEDKIRTSKSKKRSPMVTGAERLLLKQEFVSTMYQNFLDGKDNEFFDYSNVDNNSSFDNVIEIEHDAEDKYFDSEDPNEDEPRNSHESSEDELDIYMKALNQHPVVCELAKTLNKNL